MSNDLNLCQFIGRLGKDPETSATPSGTTVTKVSIAVGGQWKDSAGQKKESTTWVSVVAFGKLAEIMGQYLKKGSKVYLSGKMSVRKWQDKSGQDRYTTEIIAGDMQMLEGRGDSPAKYETKPEEPSAFDNFDSDSDIPF